MIVSIQNVTRVFQNGKKPPVIANDDISLNLREGEILGLLGHNGAGKTTLVYQVIGLLKPTKGNVFILNEPVEKDRDRARILCSVQPQSQVPLGSMTPARAVSLMGRMRGGRGKDVKQRMEYLFETLDIQNWRNTPGAELSGGVKRLTAFCMAVIHPGKVVVLDEPTNDVDPVRRRLLWEEIRKITAGGVSVILVTHNVLEAEKAVDRVAILHRGKLLIHGTPAEVKQSVKSCLRMEVGLAASSGDLKVPGWSLAERYGNGRMTISLDEGSVPFAIEWARHQLNKGLILEYALSPTTLEDAYVGLTGDGEPVEQDSEQQTASLKQPA